MTAAEQYCFRENIDLVTNSLATHAILKEALEKISKYPQLTQSKRNKTLKLAQISKEAIPGFHKRIWKYFKYLREIEK